MISPKERTFFESSRGSRRDIERCPVFRTTNFAFKVVWRWELSWTSFYQSRKALALQPRIRVLDGRPDNSSVIIHVQNIQIVDMWLLL
jgi:hypothetical protein